LRLKSNKNKMFNKEDYCLNKKIRLNIFKLAYNIDRLKYKHQNNLFRKD